MDNFLEIISVKVWSYRKYICIFTPDYKRKILNIQNMERMILKPEIVEKIQSDAILFGKVAYILGVRPSTLLQILVGNKPKLTEISVLRILKDHLKVTQDSELLTEMQVPAE